MAIVTTNLHEFGPQGLTCSVELLDEDGVAFLDETDNSICIETDAPEGGMKWLIDVLGGTTFTIPLEQFDEETGAVAMNYSFEVDWGDGSSDTVTAYNDANAAHLYSTTGQYTITINGTCERIAFNYGTNRNDILEVTQWDNIVLKDMAFAFYGCSNLTLTATDIPDTSGVKNFQQAFDSCDVLTTGFVGWDVTAVTNYKWAFFDCALLDADFSSWDVSNTQNFFSMFENSGFNNGSLSGWDMSSATDLEGMFWGCTITNLDIGGWDVSNVTTFEDMFHLSSGSLDLTNWDVSSCTNFIDMFSSSEFNGNISGWTFGTGALFFNSMFRSATLFNQDIGWWSSISNIRGVTYMFYNADAFDQDISAWDISNVTSFEGFLEFADGFSIANYDLLLNAWANISAPFSVHFDCASQYTIATSQTARDYLDITRAWTMTDGGGI